MRKRSIAAIIATAVMTTAAADYNFPSANPPGGKAPSEVTQFATIIWDDNAYSGKSGTNYEGPTTQKFQFTTNNWINGLRSEGGWITTDNKNELNLTEGMIGMSWAAQTLAGRTAYPYKMWDPITQFSPQVPDTVIYEGAVWACVGWPYKEDKDGDLVPDDLNGANHEPPQEYSAEVLAANTWFKPPWVKVKEIESGLSRTNPDGSPVLFTFNVISGLMTPTFPVDWQARKSKFGYYEPNDAFYPDGYTEANKHKTIAVSWGREMPIYTDETMSEVFTEGYITQSFKEAMEAGHEIGNHTIDHMESNSPLPVEYYEEWNTDKATNGFDYSLLDTMPWNDENGNPVVYDEAEQFGQKPGNVWQQMGWKMYAGKYIAKETWKGAIKLSEDELTEYLGLSVANGNLGAFRAPRLEVNSNLYFALSELGYQYDCGLEEGYEANVDGTNFLWPYTLDNGNPNSTYQRSIGVNVPIDSMPAGLWQIPSNVYVVPEAYRREVYDNHKSIVDAAPDGHEVESFESWTASGAKITGYDFNLYIMWGMTKEAWLATMKHTTQLRLDGNRAPLHYGAHTDYYTPIYDFATLLNDQNKASYGQNVEKGWNTWEDRITSMEEWVDWSIGKGVHFVTGARLIDEIKEMQKGEVFGEAGVIDNPSWNFFNNPDLGSTSETNSYDGDIENAKITVKGADGDKYPDARFALYESAGYFSGMTHISLDYQTTAPLRLRLMLSSGQWKEVTLGSLKNYVKSGKIPLSAFHSSQYADVQDKDPINTDDIVGIELKLETSAEKDTEETLTIKNLVLYGAEGTTPVSIADNAKVSKQGISLKGITRDQLSINVPHAGAYSISVVGLNGRVISQVNGASFARGINTIPMNNLSAGVYLVKVAGVNTQQILKSVVK